MNDPAFVLGIPHAPWVEGRKASLERLTAGLSHEASEDEPLFGASCRAHNVFDEKKANPEWSEELWAWGENALVDTRASHFLQLQDDVEVAPNFWAALTAMVQAHPAAVICLETPHPAGMTLARAGRTMYTLADGLIGVGYVIPREIFLRFRLWLKTDLKDGAREEITEDTLLAIFCLTQGLRVHCPAPTIIDHDTSLPSTYAGNDAHAYRRPAVTWKDLDVLGCDLDDMERPGFWGGLPEDPGIVHLGRFYDGVHKQAATHTRSFSGKALRAAELDVCPPILARHFR